MCDISDGLLAQGGQMAEASGVYFSLDKELISEIPEFSQLSALATEVGANVWNWVGAGGEDHVFLATGKKLKGLTIGEVTEGIGIEILGLTEVPQGFTHFE
ncbi:MAG: hypothetical protein WDO06_04450 [Actinomycetota bacterium]